MFQKRCSPLKEIVKKLEQRVEATEKHELASSVGIERIQAKLDDVLKVIEMSNLSKKCEDNSEVNKLRIENEELKGRIGVLEKLFAQSEMGRADAEQKLMTLNEETWKIEEELRQEISTLEDNIEAQNDKIVELEDEIEDLRDDYNELLKKNEQLIDQMHELKMDKIDQGYDNEDLKEKIEDLEQQLSTMLQGFEEQEEAWKREMENIRLSQCELEDRNQGLKKQLDEMKKCVGKESDAPCQLGGMSTKCMDEETGSDASSEPTDQEEEGQDDVLNRQN